MATAVITFVYNEAVNLPIWQKYYGRIFGGENLFIIDHGSSDGSTGLVGRANKILLPRTELDEHKRCVYMADFHKALLNYFDTVIYTDCDEILVPDLSEYQNLADYVDRSDFEYIAPIGLDVRNCSAPADGCKTGSQTAGSAGAYL